jgi:PAS domain S-box-containing protein
VKKSVNLPRILHVDDDQEFLLAFSLTFKDFFNTTSFDDPITAIEIMKTAQFDLIISDYEMPAMNGIEFLKEVQKGFPDIPLVFLTGQGNEKVTRDAFISGAADYFPKDLYGFAYKEKFINAIKNLLEKRKALEALRESEERNKSFLNHFQGVAFRLDNNFKPILLHGAVKAITGYSKAEVLTDDGIIQKITAETDDALLKIIAENLLKTPGIAYDQEVRIIKKDGEKRWIQLMVQSIADTSGKTVAIQGSLYDITTRKETEEKLIQREKQEQLINRISTLFINREADEINTTINISLAEIGKFTDADRSYLYLVSEDGEQIADTFEWLKEGISSQLESATNLKIKDRFKNLRGSLRKDGYFLARDIDLIPPEFDDEAEHKYIRENKSMLLVPIVYNKDSYAGVIGLDLTDKTAEWTDDTISLLKIVGEIAVNTLKRAKAEKALQGFRDNLERLVWERTGELMEANEKLRETQRQQKALLDSITDMAWLKDAESRFIAVNEPIARACGCTPEEMIGKTDFDVWAPELARQYVEADKSVMRLQCLRRIEEPCTDSNGLAIWVETIKVPIIDENGKVMGTAGVARDVTQRKQAEDILIKSRSDYEQKAKDRTIDLEKTIKLLNEENARRIKIEQELVRRNRELANLAEMVMNDLKKSLSGSHPTLKDYICDNKDADSDLTHKKSDNMLSYIDNLLSLSSANIKDNNLQSINLEYIIRQLFNKYSIGPFNANLDIAPSIPEIYCDPQSIERLFEQLISNSFKFRDPGKETLEIKLSYAAFNDNIAIVYEDNGMGIQSSELPFVFEPGYKAHNRPGDGLGLSIAKRIAETHNGEILVCSSGKNKGVRFTIKLPLPMDLLK